MTGTTAEPSSGGHHVTTPAQIKAVKEELLILQWSKCPLAPAVDPYLNSTSCCELSPSHMLDLLDFGHHLHQGRGWYSHPRETKSLGHRLALITGPTSYIQEMLGRGEARI